MARRLLYRLIIIIPVTLSILLITLFLFYQLPGAHVLDSSRIELGSDREIEQLIWQQETHPPLRQVHGLFYFEINPGYVPDSLYLIPLVFRRSVKELSRQVDNRKVMNQYIGWLHNESVALESGHESHIASRKLFQLLQATSILELSSIIESTRTSDFHLPEELIKVVESKPATEQTMLHLKWNGSQNLFHYYLKSIVTDSSVLYSLSGERVNEKFLRTVPWTLSYTLPVFLVGWVLVFCFVLRFYDRDSLLRRVDRWSVLFYSFPTFVIATLALVFLTSHRYGGVSNIFPYPVFIESESYSLLNIYRDYGRHLILPMVVFSISPIILFFRVFYEKLNEIKKTQSSYRYLRHVGISEGKFRTRYLSRYLLVATFAVLSNLFVAALGGSLIIEWIFNIPGLGRYLYESIVNYDISSIVFLIFIFTIVQQLGHILSDFIIDYFFSTEPVSSGIL